MWVLIDNYDSFTHILHHYLLEHEPECLIIRNDEMRVSDLVSLKPSRIILSPGPGNPAQAGITLNAIEQFHATIPILGVCLGHQSIGQFFGAPVTLAKTPMHGKQSPVCAVGHPLFRGLSACFVAMRYHSLVIADTAHTELDVLATAVDTHEIMAVAHQRFACIGVQFHPESVGTPEGRLLIHNWANMY